MEEFNDAARHHARRDHVGPSKLLCRIHLSVDDNVARSFDILAISLSVLHNFLMVRTKLFFDLYLVEFLGTSSFFANKAQIYSRITPLIRRWHVQTYLSATLSRCARLTGSRDVSILHAPSDPIVSNSLRNREINYHSIVQHILYSYVYPVRVRMFMLFDLYSVIWLHMALRYYLEIESTNCYK